MTTQDQSNDSFSPFGVLLGNIKRTPNGFKWGSLLGGPKAGSTNTSNTAKKAAEVGVVDRYKKYGASTADMKKKYEEEVGLSGRRLATGNNAIWQDFRLYIEGEECPFESASISFGVSVLPVMTLQLAPYKLLRNLPERTKVHLYFIDPVDSKERLLFDGEIGGVGYTKNPSVQTLTYSVTHVSNYLNEILVSFFDISAYAVTFPPLYTKTLGAGLEIDYSTYNTTTLEKILAPKELEGLDTFQEIFVRLFAEIFRVRDGAVSLNVTLAYFKKRVDEWKLAMRMATLPAASGQCNAVFRFQDFIDSENLLLLMTSKTKKIDGWQSLFTVLGEMFREILYYPTILPSPYLNHAVYSKAETATSDKKYVATSALQSILYKPQALFVLPPICNVIWPSMYTVFSYSRNYKTIPTRLFVRAGIERLLPTGKTNDDSAEPVSQYFWSPAALRDAETRLGILNEQAKLNSVVDKYKLKTDALTQSNTSQAAILDKYQPHLSLLDAVSPQEERVGVRLSQPADNEFFTRYAEWLTCGDLKPYPFLSGAKNRDDAEDKVAQLADYELARQQFETGSVSMVMVFNPYLVPGFPTLIMDKPESGIHVYGYISGVNHTISASAGCDTTIDVGYIRQYDEILRDPKTQEAVKRFIVAEDVWGDEDAVYESFLGVKSIKSAGFNTIEDKKNRNDPVKIVENISENMSKGNFCDYVYNAYVRSGRKIVTKKEYDEFVNIEKNMSDDDLKRRREIQEKVRLYRSWVEKRVAGSETLDVPAGVDDSTDAMSTGGGSVP